MVYRAESDFFFFFYVDQHVSLYVAANAKHKLCQWTSKITNHDFLSFCLTIRACSSATNCTVHSHGASPGHKQALWKWNNVEEQLNSLMINQVVARKLLLMRLCMPQKKGNVNNNVLVSQTLTAYEQQWSSWKWNRNILIAFSWQAAVGDKSPPLPYLKIKVHVLKVVSVVLVSSHHTDVCYCLYGFCFDQIKCSSLICSLF